MARLGGEDVNKGSVGATVTVTVEITDAPTESRTTTLALPTDAAVTVN